MKPNIGFCLYRLAWAGLLSLGLTACDSDLATSDGGVDQASPRDFARPRDLTSPPDLTIPPDLTELPDLTLPPECTDDMRAGDETDVNCGGSICARCPADQRCQGDNDCQSNDCDIDASTPTCQPADSCRTLNTLNMAPRRRLPSGVYTIDPDGTRGPISRFPVYCDMVTKGGGWTLITTYSSSGSVDGGEGDAPTPVLPPPPFKPPSPLTFTDKITNRNMHLPGVTQILTVNMDYDAVGYDKMEIYSGVNGTLRGEASYSNITMFQEIIDALNMNTRRLWGRDTGFEGVDDVEWSFIVEPVAGTSCQQMPFKGQYGDGNHGGANNPSEPFGVNSVGMLWHHWDSQCWLSGVTASNLFRCTPVDPSLYPPGDLCPIFAGGPGPATYQHVPFNFWKAVYLR